MSKKTSPEKRSLKPSDEEDELGELKRTSMTTIKRLDITPSRQPNEMRNSHLAVAGAPRMQRMSVMLDADQQFLSQRTPAPSRRGSTWHQNQLQIHGQGHHHPAETPRVSVTRQFALLASGAENRLVLEDKMIRLPLFASCDKDFVNNLSQCVLSKSFSADQAITKSGCPGESLFLFLSGSVNVFIDQDQVAQVQTGEWWGEANLLGVDQEWSASLIAKETCNVCEVRRDDFLNVLYENPEESAYFDHLMSRNRLCKTDGTLHNTCEILSGLRDDTLLSIDAKMVRRFFFPGEYFLEQGAPGDELYILVRGHADVEIAGRVVRQEFRGSNFGSLGLGDDTVLEELEEMRQNSGSQQGASAPLATHRRSTTTTASSTTEEAVEASEPICFGELGLLGIQQVRSASVVAHSVCQVRVLYRPVFMKALEAHGESLQLQRMDSFMERRYTEHGSQLQPIQRLKEVGIFQEVGCSETFMDFLAQHLEDRMYLAGQKIIDENCTDDRCMYILSSGSAKVLKGGVEVGSLSGGAVFGEVVLLGLTTKRTSTIIANEVCYAQVLHQSVVIRGLELFPEERQKVLMIAFKRDVSNEQPPSTGLDSLQKTPGGEDWKANNLRAVIKAVKSSDLFSDISADFMEALSAEAADRIYMPGDIIIQEGQKGDSLFIMVSGQAAVYTSGGDRHVAAAVTDENRKRKSAEDDKNPKDRRKRESLALRMTRIGMLTAGSISGELAMLGVSQTRSATIEAETICVMWEITNEKAMPVIEKFPDTRNDFLTSICEHLKHTVSNCIDSLDLFKNFERKFRMLLGLYCEPRAYFPGQQIFYEGHQGDGLYVLNLGQGHLERKNTSIKRVMSGSHFNSTIMLGFHKWCFCTLTATHTCHVVVVSRISYLQALEQYPSHQAHQDMARSEQVANEEFREAVRRLCTRGQIWNKSQVAVADAFSRLTDKVTVSEALRRVLKTWQHFARNSARQRRERYSRKRSTELWVHKQRDAIARRQQRDSEIALARLGTREAFGNERLPISSPTSLRVSPRARVTKYTKLSSLYLHGPQDWASIFPIPRSPRQRQLWGLPAEVAEDDVQRLPELFGKARTPREARVVVMDQQAPLGGSRVADFASQWEPPESLWETGDSSLDWDVTQMLCQ